MRIEVLFYISLVLCVLSFLLLTYQVIVQIQRTAPPAPPTGLGQAAPQAFDVGQVLEEMGKLAQSFAKAGPIATTAALCALFALIALITSGAIKIGT